MSEPTEITVTVRIGTHGRSGYNRGCRCKVCKKASSDYHREALAANRMRTEDAPHGTRGGYCNWGCRCDPCKAAHSEYMKVYQAARRSEAAIYDPPVQRWETTLSDEGGDLG